MIVAFLKDLSWTVVVLFVIVLAACCFLAVLWSRREWQSRKIRVGMFLEREYGQGPEVEEEAEPPADDAPTKEMKPDAW